MGAAGTGVADEPDNMILRLLREIRAKQDEHSSVLSEHGQRLKMIDRRLDEVHETMYTVAGLAAHSNVRHDSVADRLEAIEERVRKLEEKA